MGRILKARDIEAGGVTVKNVRLGEPTGAAAHAPPLLPTSRAPCPAENVPVAAPRPYTSEMARAELAEDIERARRVLQEITDRVAEHDRRMAEQAGRRLIDLGIAIARRILREQVELDPAVVQRAAREALEEASRAEQVDVHVNPRDLPVLEAASDALLDALDSLRGLTVVPDPDVARGGVVLHTDVGVVDGQIETQLAEVRQALVELDEARQTDEQEP